MKPKIQIIEFPLIHAAAIRRDWYRTLSPWRCVFKINNITVTIRIDKGAEWDGASIHRMFWSILGLHPGGLMLRSSLPHDGLCLTHRGNQPDWFHIYIHGELEITPYIRDHLFRECCRYVGVLKRRARIMWFAVTIYQRLQSRKYNISYK